MGVERQLGRAQGLAGLQRGVAGEGQAVSAGDAPPRAGHLLRSPGTVRATSLRVSPPTTVWLTAALPG